MAIADSRVAGSGSSRESNGPATSPGKAFVKRALRQASQGGFAVLEQGIFSGSNFVLSFLLARWLATDQYGSYRYAYAIFLLLSLLYQPLVVEPMAVFGCSEYQNCLRGYWRSVLKMQVLLTIVIVVLSGAYAAFSHGQAGGLSGALWGMTIAAPCVLLSWLARRGFYLKLRPAFAALGSIIYSGIMLGGLYYFHRFGLVTPFVAFGLMAAGSVVAGLLLLARLRSVFLSSDAPAPSLAQTWRRHWVYGRWALAASLVAWFPSYIYFPALKWFAGMDQVGNLGVLLNLVTPIQQAYGALSVFFLAYAAGVQGRKGVAGLKSLSFWFTGMFATGAIIYWLLILPFTHQVFQVLYHGRYLDIAHLLPLAGLGCILWSAVLGQNVVLRAMEAPSLVFWSQLGSCILGLLVGLPLTRFWSLSGALWGLVISNLGAFIICAFLLRSRVRNAEPASV
jgi:O-antigen/teichoic acid export membrane protein